MKLALICISIQMLTFSISMSWDRTDYDTVNTKWTNGEQKEFITRYWHRGNEKGFRPHGQHSTWYENGRLKEDSYYDRNSRIGASIKWDEDGGRTEESVLVDGKLHGMHIEWHRDRNIKTLGNYNRGQKHGLWTYRQPGGDMHNFSHYIDSAHYYYERKLAVKLQGLLGDRIHKQNSYFSDELQMWIEWKWRNTYDWMNSYVWFDLGKKFDGHKDGKWIRLNHHGEIMDINYYKNGEPLR